MRVWWQEPSDTGFGDASAPVRYIVETSNCADFGNRSGCLYHVQEVDGGSEGGAQDRVLARS